MKQTIEDRLLAFQATLANEHAELIEDALDELENRSDSELRLIAKIMMIYAASGADLQIKFNDFLDFVRALRKRADAQ